MSQTKKPKLKFWQAIPIVIFMGLAITFLVRLYGEDPSYIPSVMVQKSMPVFQLNPLGDYQTFSSQSIIDDAKDNGNVVIINFWASWCVACRAEHIELEKLKKLGIKIYGINHKDNDANAIEFLSKYGNVYHAIGTNTNGRVAIDFGVRALPETFIIDQHGVIRYKQIGPILSGDGYDNFVKQYNASKLPIKTDE